MERLIEILFKSEYYTYGFIGIAALLLIKVVWTIWKVIKENKALNAIDKEGVEEVKIDKTGAIFVKMKNNYNQDITGSNNSPS